MSTQLKLTFQRNKKTGRRQERPRGKESGINREFDLDEDADIDDVLWKGGRKRTQG